MLTKTCSILVASRPTVPGHYGQDDEDSGATTRTVVLDLPTWEDLGRPSVITVTVEPGDTLN